MTRFKKDEAAQKALAQTVVLSDVKSDDFDTAFYLGGHGPMWDLAESPISISLLESFYNSGKPIALVCHSPGVLRHVTYQGAPLVKGRHVAGFTNGEEAEMQLTKIVRFLVEDELMRLGAIFEKKADWQPFSIVDGLLVTGQNPASSTSAALALLELLAVQKAASMLDGISAGMAALTSWPSALQVGSLKDSLRHPPPRPRQLAPKQRGPRMVFHMRTFAATAST